ncbi:hypothetical protein CYMTET_8693 [Cymbomonas tetramitiformis]|uniref:SMODS and SLOG-associating 2TM effector domain-containing protein n=1 Tax=Cymbomonas tetramitiformis TaxID=36881 RepID=A0AAE0GSX0_9CHLO|nr:hypothetical protein CYMTET_8693 [Cymbomonas tetramitiformis]|eukprot:gene3212-4058_t
MFKGRAKKSSFSDAGPNGEMENFSSGPNGEMENFSSGYYSDIGSNAEEVLIHGQNESAVKSLGFDKIELDDYVSPLTVDAYIAHRVKPMFKKYQAQAPYLARNMQSLEVLGFCVTACGTMLATLQYQEWVAFTVLLGTTIANIVKHTGLPRHVAATNVCLKSLQNLITFWDALSLVDRRTRRVKSHCLAVMEGAILDEAAAWTDSARSQSEEEVVLASSHRGTGKNEAKDK